MLMQSPCGALAKRAHDNVEKERIDVSSKIQ